MQQIKSLWKTSARVRQPTRFPPPSESPQVTLWLEAAPHGSSHEKDLCHFCKHVSHKHHGHTPEEGFGVTGQEASYAFHIRWSHVSTQNMACFKQVDVSDLQIHHHQMWSTAGLYIIPAAAWAPALWRRLQRCYNSFRNSWRINTAQHPQQAALGTEGFCTVADI